MSRYVGIAGFRSHISVLVKIGVPAAAIAAALAVPAYAAGPHGTAAPHRIRLIAPLASPGRMTARQAATAAATCTRYTTRAGWAANGYYAGDLVSAAAVCAAESHGDPKLYACDENGKVVKTGDYVPGKPVPCPAGTTSYDRGLWQLNSVAASGTSDACAFNPVCNAAAAYLDSGRGTTFGPWATYDNDQYSSDIDAAQAAATDLHSGTVTSAMLGECLQATSKAGARVVIANCGPGGTVQQWAVSGGHLRSGSVCAAIASASASAPGIVLRRCANEKIQQWTVTGRDELRNGADGKCLTDPNGNLTAGTQVDAAGCRNAKDQTWWLP
jgi:Ricin-type beta-trefoil lectin domain/Lysozyme like domain